MIVNKYTNEITFSKSIQIIKIEKKKNFGDHLEGHIL